MKFAPAWRFIFLIGVVSFFADITYEGGRGLSGPFLYSLGASATAVGFVSGLGELVGYALRWLFGTLSQRSGKYWGFTLAGFALNLAAARDLYARALGERLAEVRKTLEREGSNGLKGATYADLAKSEQVKKLVQPVFDELNATLPSYETIKYFALLPEDLTLENGALTPTLKEIGRAHV